MKKKALTSLPWRSVGPPRTWGRGAASRARGPRRSRAPPHACSWTSPRRSYREILAGIKRNVIVSKPRNLHRCPKGGPGSNSPYIPSYQYLGDSKNPWIATGGPVGTVNTSCASGSFSNWRIRIEITLAIPIIQHFYCRFLTSDKRKDSVYLQIHRAVFPCLCEPGKVLQSLAVRVELVVDLGLVPLVSTHHRRKGRVLSPPEKQLLRPEWKACILIFCYQGYILCKILW